MPFDKTSRKFVVTRRFLTVLIFCVVFRPPTIGQSTQAPIQSPKQVVEAYRRMDANGERLTMSGWKKASVFFLHPGPAPREKVLGVMAGETIGEATVNGEKAEVWTEFDFLGKVYSDGRFSRSLGGSPPTSGPLSSSRKYKLVLAAQSNDPRTEDGPRWKIEDFEPNPTVTLDVAIHYLEGLRDKSDSQSVKENAEKSIAELRAFRNERRR